MNTGKLLIPLNLRILPHNRNLLIPLGLSESCNNAPSTKDETDRRETETPSERKIGCKVGGELRKPCSGSRCGPKIDLEEAAAVHV